MYYAQLFDESVLSVVLHMHFICVMRRLLSRMTPGFHCCYHLIYIFAFYFKVTSWWCAFSLGKIWIRCNIEVYDLPLHRDSSGRRRTAHVAMTVEEVLMPSRRYNDSRCKIAFVSALCILKRGRCGYKYCSLCINAIPLMPLKNDEHKICWYVSHVARVIFGNKSP